MNIRSWYLSSDPEWRLHHRSPNLRILKWGRRCDTGVKRCAGAVPVSCCGGGDPVLQTDRPMPRRAEGMAKGRAFPLETCAGVPRSDRATPPRIKMLPYPEKAGTLKLCAKHRRRFFVYRALTERSDVEGGELPYSQTSTKNVP